MVTGGARRHETGGGDAEAEQIATLAGIYDGIAAIRHDLSNYNRGHQQYLAAIDNTMTAGEPVDNVWAWQEAALRRLDDAERLYGQAGMKLDDYVSEIAGIAGQVHGQEARIAAFRTAAYLEVNGHSRSDPMPGASDRAEAFAASLAASQIHDPVLLIRPDEGPSFTAGYLAAPFRLEQAAVRGAHPLRRKFVLRAAAALLRERPDSLHPPEGTLMIDLRTGAQADGSYNRVLVGALSIAAEVRAMISGGIGPRPQAELICRLAHTGKSLTELGYDADSLSVAETNLRARLRVLRAQQEDREEMSAEDERSLAVIDEALAIIEEYRR